MRIKKLLVLLSLALLPTLFLPNLVNADSSVTGKTIVLDPGHGGSDSGAIATGANGTLREADVTWDIARRLRTLLEADNVTVYLTRDCDCDKSNNDRYSLANN